MSLNIAIITSITRPNRQSRAVAEWVHSVASTRAEAGVGYTIVDIAERDLPLFDEPGPPLFGEYLHEYTKAWSEVVSTFDGYLFVTGEYNHAAPPALTNAISFLYQEWTNKAAGFVSYGSAGGVRAVENLRLIAAELQMATVRTSLGFSLAEDFVDYQRFTPRPNREPILHETLDQLTLWAQALKNLRDELTSQR